MLGRINLKYFFWVKHKDFLRHGQIDTTLSNNHRTTDIDEDFSSTGQQLKPNHLKGGLLFYFIVLIILFNFIFPTIDQDSNKSGS